MRSKAILSCVLVLNLFSFTLSQELPGKIRGYKVYENKIKVANYSDQKAKSDGTDVFVKLGKPKIVDIGLLGATVEAGIEITVMDQSGRVEFLTFRDFRINGIAVDVEEYDHPFSFTKREMAALPNPIRVTVGITSIPRAAYSEIFEKSKEFAITGTVFVFGKFKKFGFSFKRIVPIKIDLKVKNLLR